MITQPKLQTLLLTKATQPLSVLTAAPQRQQLICESSLPTQHERFGKPKKVRRPPRISIKEALEFVRKTFGFFTIFVGASFLAYSFSLPIIFATFELNSDIKTHNQYENNNIIISAVHFNPDGTDTGKEWLELYNPTNQTIALANYEIWLGNGDKENDWRFVSSLNGSIAPQSFFLIGESFVTQSDIVSKLAFQNGPDAVAILQKPQSSTNLDINHSITSTLNITQSHFNRSHIIDLVGYGKHTLSEYYWGSSASDKSPLVRNSEIIENRDLTKTLHFSQTQNNSFDFMHIRETDYTPRNTRTSVYSILYNTVSEELSYILYVENIAPIIRNITIDSSHIFYTKQILISIDAYDLNNDTLTYTAKLKEGNYVIFETQFEPNKPLHIPTSVKGDYELEVIVSDELDFTSFSYPLSILPAIGIEANQSVLEFRKNPLNSSEFIASMYLTNIGTVHTTFDVILYNDTFDFRVNESSLLVSESKHVAITLIPKTTLKSGSHIGLFRIIARERG
jgi:hypothetical protein